MEQLLSLSAKNLIKESPHLSRQVRAGLLLALCGKVAPTETGWIVAGQTSKGAYSHIYMVTDKPGGWHCNCPAWEYNSPAEPDFLGQPGKICKHVAAVAICLGVNVYLEKPASVWILIERLVRAQHLPAPGDAWALPGSPATIKRFDRGGKDVIVLQTGRTRSKPLVKWATRYGQTNAGLWALDNSAQQNYTEWVEEITKELYAETN